MKKKLNIKNFRVFDETGASFELNPITILTGGNSSGKSSVNKALILFKTYIDKVREDIRKGTTPNLSAYKLDFAATAEILKLGNFHQVLHNGSKNELITFEITTYSRLIGEDVKVTFAFGPDKNDTLDNGYLRLIEFRRADDTLLYRVEDKQYGTVVSEAHFNILKDSFFRFFNTIFYWILSDYNFEIHHLCENESEYGHFVEKFWCVGTDSYKDFFRYKLFKYRDIVRQYDNTYKNHLKVFCFPNAKSYPYDATSPYYNEIESIINGHLSILEESFQLGLFFYIPILDELWQLRKSEVRSFLESHIKLEDNWNGALKAIIDDFEESEFEQFGDYYKEKEFEFINSVYGGGCSVSFPLPNVDFDDVYYVNWPNNDELCEVARGSENPDAFIKWREKKHCNLELILRILNTDSEKYKDYSLGYIYKCYGLFKKFVKWTFEDIITTLIPDDFYYYSSNSSAIKRIYTLESADEFSTTIQKYVECQKQFNGFLDDKSYRESGEHIEQRIRLEESNFKPGCFINKWLKTMDVADEIAIDDVGDGLGLTISTRKTNEDKTTLLANQGVGVTQLVALLLRVETIIMNNLMKDFYYWESNGKQGIRYKETLIILEEPEIHLHPKFQSLLAEMFLDAYEKYNIHFIVETHSEYLIRKTQVLVAEKNYVNENELNEKNSFKIYYVPNGDKPYEMKFRTDGCFENDFGEGFFDEAENLAFKLM